MAKTGRTKVSEKNGKNRESHKAEWQLYTEMAKTAKYFTKTDIALWDTC